MQLVFVHQYWDQIEVVSSTYTDLPDGQDVEHCLESHPEEDQAQRLRVPQGVEGRYRGRGIGQTGVTQVHLQDDEEHPGGQEEQPEVGSWKTGSDIEGVSGHTRSHTRASLRNLPILPPKSRLGVGLATVGGATGVAASFCSASASAALASPSSFLRRRL